MEELDAVFDIGNRSHSKYYRQKIPFYMQRWTGRGKGKKYPTLMETTAESTMGHHVSITDEKDVGKV